RRKVFGVGVTVGVEGVGNHRNGRFCRPGVGDHFVGRFWFAPPPATGRTHRNPRRFQVRACGFPTDSGRLLDAPQRPAQPSQSYDLLFLLFVQDIGHAHGAYKPPRESMSRTLLSLAGFQVIITGRFWVIAEDIAGVGILARFSISGRAMSADTLTPGSKSKPAPSSSSRLPQSTNPENTWGAFTRFHSASPKTFSMSLNNLMHSVSPQTPVNMYSVPLNGFREDTSCGESGNDLG